MLTLGIDVMKRVGHDGTVCAMSIETAAESLTPLWSLLVETISMHVTIYFLAADMMLSEGSEALIDASRLGILHGCARHPRCRVSRPRHDPVKGLGC